MSMKIFIVKTLPTSGSEEISKLLVSKTIITLQFEDGGY